MESLGPDGQKIKALYPSLQMMADQGLIDTTSTSTATTEYINQAFVGQV